MRVADFHFDLPEELVAQHPPAVRGASRMLVVDRAAAAGQPGALTDAMFADLPGYLRTGDLLVLNDSRVLPARLFATRPGAAGRIEVLLVEEVDGSEGDSSPAKQSLDGAPGKVWRALVRPAKKVRVGERLEFWGGDLAYRAGMTPLTAGIPPKQSLDGPPDLVAEVVGAGEFGERTLRFAPVEDFLGVVGRIGHMPLPPYIRREQAREADSAEDRERYQTVYADEVGSAAAPTAGLHFTPEILAELRAKGVEIATVTLHVGLGTFQPVRVDRLEDIRLHSERYTLPAATAEALNRAMVEGRRVVAVGTTTTRVLEHVAAEAEGAEEVTPSAQIPPVAKESRLMARLKSRPFKAPPFSTSSEARHALRFEAHAGETSIFIGPGHRFRVVGGLLTNFHLPESTLLMLVSAFAGREVVLDAYAHAVREGYRFYSYGDCMLVV